ncbi:hypothetical protein [Mesorhizobium australicum]|uniref:hypothetical protein n=1 Tax=Mesorhizobium australicum TaxID=536018 RepID=UPI003337B69C
MNSEFARSSIGSLAVIPEVKTGVLLLGHGGFEKLQYRDDIPVPAQGPGEVLIRVAAAGNNNADVNTRIGWYSKSVKSGTKEGALGASKHLRAPTLLGPEFRCAFRELKVLPVVNVSPSPARLRGAWAEGG